MCLPDEQGHSGGNGTPPKRRKDDQIRGDLPGVSIRTVISLVFSPHETVDGRLIEVPLSMSRRSIVSVVVLVVVTFGAWLYVRFHSFFPRRPPTSVVQTLRPARSSQESVRASRISVATATTAHLNAAQPRGFQQEKYNELRKKFRASEGTAYGPMDARDLGYIASSIKLQLRDPSLWPIVKDVLYGKTSALEDALNSGLSPNVVIEKGNGNVESLLDMAIDAGQRGSVKALVAHGAAVNLDQYALGKYGASSRETTYVEPLVDAAAAGQDDMVQYLLENGANINGRNNLSPLIGGTQTALAAAASGGNASTVYLLLTNGASVNSVLDPNGHVPQDLIQAGKSKPQYAAVVELLLSYGATMPPTS